MSALGTFLGGLAVLLAAGQLVITQSSALGRRFGLTPLVVGMTIVAAGTSAPELAVVGQSIAVDDTELAVGSIIGSNIANVLLLLGMTAAFGAVRVSLRLTWIDIPVMIGASTALLLFTLDGVLGRPEAAALLVALVVFVVWTVWAARSEDDGSRAVTTTRQRSITAEVGLLAAGIAALVVAARFVVSGAEGIATGLGMPELIVGLTVVALGTSSPEIATTVLAARRGDRELAVGNAIGSNIFNILLVLGATGVFAPSGIAISDDAVQLDLPVMLAAAVACLPIVAADHTLDRWEGWLFVAFYVAYVTFLVLDGTGHRAQDPFALVMIAFVIPLAAITVVTVAYRQYRRRRS